MLTIEDLTFAYDANQNIFSRQSWKIPQSAAFIGGNGSGKTTLLKLIAKCLIPQSGAITFNRKPLYRCATCFDDALIFDDFSIDANIRLLPQNLINRARFNDAVQTFSLPMRARAGSLSRGQRQCLALAITLACNADLYLLDEPRQHLDKARQISLQSLLARFSSAGANILITDHPESPLFWKPPFYPTHLDKNE